MNDQTEAKKLHNSRFKLACDTPLGSGSFGVVQKVLFQSNNRSICLARKIVHPPYRKYPLEKLRDEANVMEKLDHEHIVKLVGTYCLQSSLFILLWPVAVCNLDRLLADIDSLRTGQGDREDIIGRLHALDLKDLAAVNCPPARTSPNRCNCPLQYLRQITGCITRAVAYCHDANIRHLDLKPSNILLSSGRVYLADFGIAKDVHNRDNTMTIGAQGTPKWRAPEVQQTYNNWSMKAADVYSLGLVLFNIATTIYYAPLDDFDAILKETSSARDERLRQYARNLEARALATQQVEDVNAPTFGPRHIVHLASKMVSKDPASRPVIQQVNSELVELGGIEQVYHSPCCKSSSRFVTERMNTKLRVAIDERNRLRLEHDEMAKRLRSLEANHETYETRLVNERKAHGENIAKLQIQLDRERTERKRLEALVAEIQQHSNRRQHRPGIPRPATERKPAHANPSPGGLMMRTRTHPSAVPASHHRPPPPPTYIQHPSPAPSTTSHHTSPRPSYSQTAAAAITPLAAAPSRRDSLIPTPSPIPSPLPPHHTPSPTPSSDLTNFPLRSRPSGSRLPRAVNPTTPIRSNTPLLNRDLSSTDTSQYSMSSSVFSLNRLSLSKASLGAESGVSSVVGTPEQGGQGQGQGQGQMRERSSRTVVPVPRPGKFGEMRGEKEGGNGNEKEDENESGEEEHGLGLGMTDPEVEPAEPEPEPESENAFAHLHHQHHHHQHHHHHEVERMRMRRRESVVSGVSMASGVSAVSGRSGMAGAGETGSVVSGSVSVSGGVLSPVLSGSVMSSPRMVHAQVEGVRGGVPPLPTAKSWADVARKRGR